jgi:hypothetical protein
MPVDAALIQVAPAGRERDVQPRHLGQRDVRGGVRRQARERPCQSRDAQNAATAASRSIGIRPARSGRPAAGHEPADGIADQIVAYVSPPPSTWASSARGSSCVGAPVTRSPRARRAPARRPRGPHPAGAVCSPFLRADARTRTGDPFITRPLQGFAVVPSSGMKSLQTLHFCRSDMTALYPPRPGFRTQ